MRCFISILIFSFLIASCGNKVDKELEILTTAFDQILKSKELGDYLKRNGYSYNDSILGVSFYGDGPSYSIFSEDLSTFDDLKKHLNESVHKELGIDENLSAYLFSIQDYYANTKECYYFTMPLELVDEEKEILVSFSKPFHGFLTAKVFKNKHEKLNDFEEVLGFLFVYDKNGKPVKTIGKTYKEKAIDVGLR